MISLSKYEELARRLSTQAVKPQELHPMAAEYGVPVDALLCINSFESQQRIMRLHRRMTDILPSLVQQYRQGADIESLAYEYSCPPVYLMRRLLEADVLGRTPSTSRALKPSRVMRTPGDVLNHMSNGEFGDLALPQRVCSDVSRVSRADSVHSSYADIVRHTAGHEYEAVLYGKLRAAGIAVWSEETLRDLGYHKTPDVRLQVPVLVRGHLVCWIDSKATFGGPRSHRQQMTAQYDKYINRFGPGLVIYWFGFVRELQGEHEDLLLLDSFPSPQDLVMLPRLPCT